MNDSRLYNNTSGGSKSHTPNWSYLFTILEIKLQTNTQVDVKAGNYTFSGILLVTISLEIILL